MMASISVLWVDDKREALAVRAMRRGWIRDVLRRDSESGVWDRLAMMGLSWESRSSYVVGSP